MKLRSIVSVCSILVVIACDSSSGSGDSETHWIQCETDLDCPAHMFCEAKHCIPVPDAGAGDSGTAGDGGTSGGGAGGVAEASSGGRAASSSGGRADASAEDPSDASVSDAREAPADAGDASGIDARAEGPDAAESSVTSTCATPGSDYFVDPLGGSDDSGTGSGLSGSGAPTSACAFKTITRAVAALPSSPAPGTRVVVIGPATVSTGETFPITLPENVVLTTQGGDVSLTLAGISGAGFFRLVHPNSGIRGGAGAALTLGFSVNYGVQVAPGSDDTTFVEDVVIRDSLGYGIQVNPGARLTVGEGVTATANQIGMSVAGHVTVSVPVGHRTTSFSGNQFANMPPPPSGGWGIFVSGSMTLSGVPGATLGTGTVVVNGNDGSGVYIDQRGVASPRQIVIDGLVAYGNGVPPTPGGYAYSGIVIGGGSNVRLRNSVVLGNGTAGVEVRTITTFDNRRLNDLTKIDLGVGGLADGGSDYGHNVVQALPGEGANGGAGICLFVDPNTGTLNAAGNVFAGPRDCAAASPGALTFSNLCGVHADLGIVTLTDGGLVMDGGGTLGNDINASNCTR